MGIFTYVFKVNKILKSDSATAAFAPSEVVSAIVNLVEAKKVLSNTEYQFVYAVFETYKQSKSKRYLSKQGYLDLCKEIAAHFDLIAPYYKFCGDSKMQILMLEESGKKEFRNRAKILLDKGAIFEDEWTKLHKEFLESFCVYF